MLRAVLFIGTGRKGPRLIYSIVMPKIYRDVYLKKGLPRFRGRTPLYYTGRLHANSTPEDLKAFDRLQDIYLGCDCDRDKWSQVIRMKNKNNR